MVSSTPRPNIAIDGPAGAGKTTIARLLASRLGFAYVSTGSLYRALTLGLLQRGVAPGDIEAVPDLHSLLSSIHIAVQYVGGEQRVLLDGVDVTDRLSEPMVASAVSDVSRVKAVRDRLLSLQRECASGGGIVMDGRDIGTVVLKDAQFKFFLTASVDERVDRRYRELLAEGIQTDKSQLREAIIRRDAMDSTREISPLRRADDSIEVDTTGKSVDEVVEELLSHIGYKR